MAPFIGPNKKAVIKALRRFKKGRFENITLGRYEPKFVIHFIEGGYRLSPLVVNEAKAAHIARERQAEGYYVPEMVWQSLEPGAPVIEEPDLSLFIRRLESWPGWGEAE